MHCPLAIIYREDITNYVTNNIIYIVKANNLEIISEVKVEKEDERFWIFEIYLNKDKLVLIGTSNILLEPVVENKEEKMNSISFRHNSVASAKAIIYNIENKNGGKLMSTKVVEIKTLKVGFDIENIHITEKAMDIKLSDRVRAIRVMMLELNRIASHLLWIGAFLMDLGATSPFFYAMREREMILRYLLQKMSLMNIYMN